MNLAMWYRMWEQLIPGCADMGNFPIWLRMLPKCLFRIIDKKGAYMYNYIYQHLDRKIDWASMTDPYTIQFAGGGGAYIRGHECPIPTPFNLREGGDEYPGIECPAFGI